MNEPGPVESLGQEGFQQAVLEEMRAFVVDTRYGRAHYSNIVRRQHLAMMVAAGEIGRYQGTDVYILSRMVGWMVDVYNQAVGIDVLQKRYPRASTGDALVFRNTKEKIIETMKHAMDEPLEASRLGAFRWLFDVICPEGIEPGFIQRFRWSRKYGKDGYANFGIPDTIDQKDLTDYFRKNLPPIENQK